MAFAGLGKSEKSKLETELVPEPIRLNLTRLVRRRCKSSDPNVELVNINRFVNIARTTLGKTIYVLTTDDMGMYEAPEFGWHFAELELIFRRPDTSDLADLLCDLIENELLDVFEVNELLESGNVSFRFATDDDGSVTLELLSIGELEADSISDEHPNIRLLVERMEAAFEGEDYSAVLHASAIVFETLAKFAFASPTVENSTFGSIFEGYRNRSRVRTH